MQPNNPNPYYPPQGSAPQPQPPQPQGGPGVPFGQPGIPPVPGASLPGAGQQLGHNDMHNRKPIALIITIVVLSVLFLGAGGFGAWAFTERQDYKDKSDQKVAVAVEEAEKRTTEENNLQFAEEIKNPLKTYQGPSAFGSVKVLYPKTWSGYIDQTGGNSRPLVAQFHPDVVPAIEGINSGQAIALQISVLNEPYDRSVARHEGAVSRGDLKAAPYALPKMSKEIGMKFQGKINQELNGTEIILPLRDKTLVITTQTDQYLKDFNTYILPNLTFVP